MPNVTVTQTENGDYFAGFEVDGTFIPFANVSANRVAQLQERAEGLKALAQEEGEGAKGRHDEAANALPYTTKPKATAKGGE